jgi:hypothetical protein
MSTNNSTDPTKIKVSSVVGSWSVVNTAAVVNTRILTTYSTSSRLSGGYVSSQKPFFQTIKPWHRWWAWRPVKTIGQKPIWGEWCYRRTVRKMENSEFYEREEYGDLFDMISSPAE